MFNLLKTLFGANPKPGKKKAKKAAQPRTEREKAIARMNAQAKDMVSPERAELIRKAMEVRRAKQTILADLSDAQRQKLVAVAVQKLMREGKE